MEPFIYDSFDTSNVKSNNKKIKLIFVLILASTILLISFDIFIVVSLHENSEISERIEASITSTNERIDKLQKVITSTNESIDRLQKVITYNNKTEEFIHQELDKTSDKMLKVIENKTQNMLTIMESNKQNMETMNKTIELHFNEGKMFTFQQDGFCLDTMNSTQNKSPELFKCHEHGGNQEWDLTTIGELKNRKSCVTLINATSEVTLDVCNGTSNQQWKFTAGVLRSPEYDMCIETNETNIFAAKCNPTIKRQRFTSKLIYIIERVCTFKQGSYAFPNDDKWIITNGGYMLHDTQCLTYERGALSYSKTLCNKLTTQKWKYTEDGQIMNLYENVCVGKNGDKIEIKKCDLNLESQRWICA